jgi:hypothetical protein
MKKSNLTRRDWMSALSASALGAGLLNDASRPLSAQPSCTAGGTIIDTHIHMWKLPRSLPPTSTSAHIPAIPPTGFAAASPPPILAA